MTFTEIVTSFSFLRGRQRELGASSHILFDKNPNPSTNKGRRVVLSRRRRVWEADEDAGLDENFNLEAEILDFMRNSSKLQDFPTKEELIATGRMDLVLTIATQGGWLPFGWDLEEEQEKEEITTTVGQENEAITTDHQDNEARNGNGGKEEWGIVGILSLLENERMLSYTVESREKESISWILGKDGEDDWRGDAGYLAKLMQNGCSTIVMFSNAIRGTASYPTSRCCPSKFDEFFRSLELRKAHTDMLERGPFGALLNLEGLKLHKAILTVLVRSWIPKSRAFQIGGILLPFEVRDLALALNLSLVGDRIRIDWDSTEEVEGWRFSGAWARFGEIADVIRAESRSDEIASVHATVRHVLLLLCCCVLFARADPVDHRTKSCLFPYLGAETVGRIAWAYPVYDFLVESLDSYSKNGKTGYITGCAIMLQVWLFEHTTLWAPSAPDAHPRLLKWITGIDTRRSDHAALIRQIRDGRLKKTQVRPTASVLP
ncbi:uncharacterized protein LOC143888597 [Tasmannia lanceolata]|uniref:uncharacterized protein LOC143888597 n=1 Tax=Tasmannia lanceolata TaxID=3420 RepID=UPI00406405FE